MANNKSAKKRILISKRNTLQNRFYKSSVRTLTKRFLQDLETYKGSQNNTDKEKAQILLNSIYSLIDKGLKKNVYHKNTVSYQGFNILFKKNIENIKIFIIKTFHFVLNILYFTKQKYNIKYNINTDLYTSKFYLWRITNQQKNAY